MKILLSLIFLLGFSFSASADTSVQVLLNNQPLGANLTVYCFHATGVYAGLTAKTNTESVAAFNLETGEYKFRHTYEGVQFWSGIISVENNTRINIPAPTSVTVKLGNEQLGTGLTIYPFTAEGTYIGYTKKTDADSTAYFNLPAGDYKFRYTHEGVQFWSETGPAFAQTQIIIPLPTTVSLQLDGQNLGENLTVYPFAAAGTYVGYTKKTDADSTAYFNLSGGEYKFRYTYNGVQFWSDIISAENNALINIPAPTQVTVKLGTQPLGENLTVYPFTATGAYVGYTKKTDADSIAYFNLLAGDYKFRYTYEGVQFWSNIISAGTAGEINLPSPVTAVTVKLGIQPLGEELTVYPFTADGTYIGYTKSTDINSTAYFDLPAGEYKFRYTYEGVQFWSDITSASTQTDIYIPLPTSVILQLDGQNMGENLTVYPFTADGSYIGYTQKTDAESIAYFNLPTGEYKFRYTYEGVQFWSDIISAENNALLNIPAPTPVIIKLGTQPLGENLTVYPFTAAGAYLGYTKKTDANSAAHFNLPAGDYKFRYTYDGVQFWSEITPAFQVTEIAIPQPTTVTVLRFGEPFSENLTIYPFTATGTYLGYTKKTNTDSTASFNLPAGTYNFRTTIEGVIHWLYGISAEENTLLHTNHTRITLQNQGAPAGSDIACVLLNANGNETATTFVTDESSTLIALSPEDNFHLKCTREDGAQALTRNINAREDTTLDFMAQVTWRLHYGINKPNNYTEKICFTDTFTEKEKCFTAQDEYSTVINVGTYNLTHKLEHRTYDLGKIDLVLSDSVQEFDFNLPDIRQLLFTIAENPQANVELRLLRGETKLFGHTNDSGLFYFTENGEWQVYRQHEFVGIIPAGQNSVHLNPDIPPLPTNTNPNAGSELINPYDYDLVTEGLTEIFIPDCSGSFINPTARTYGHNLNTAFNQSALSIPFYSTSTSTTELKFLLFKSAVDYMIETEPVPILEIPFPVQPGENEFIWYGVNNRRRLFKPGYYYFRIKPKDAAEALEIKIYDKNLAITGKNTVDFALTY